MDWLNYNQLYYFWIIAQEMSVTRAAKRLRLSQSNLSGQLKILESSLGHPLFDRHKRALRLTESGKLALNYANEIFSSGKEFLSALKDAPSSGSEQVVRVGAVSGLSKNLQFEFIKPLLLEGEVRLQMLEGSLSSLTRELQDHSLDVVISNAPARSDQMPQVYNHRLGEVPIFLVGTKEFQNVSKGFPKSLENCPVFLPGRSGRFRSEFEAYIEREKVKIKTRAEIEDMALLRLFAVSGRGVAVIPEIVVRYDLDRKALVVLKRLTGLSETFYAITSTRKFPNPWIEKTVKRFADDQRKHL